MSTEFEKMWERVQSLEERVTTLEAGGVPKSFVELTELAYEMFRTGSSEDGWPPWIGLDLGEQDLWLRIISTVVTHSALGKAH